MTFPTKITPLGTALASVLTLGACASSDLGEQMGRDGAADRIRAAQAQADADSARLDDIPDSGMPGNVSVRDGLYLGEDGFRTGRGDPLPRALETDQGISMYFPEPLDIRTFAMELRRATGLRVDYRDLSVTPGLDMGPEESGDDSAGLGGGADSTGGAGGQARAPIEDTDALELSDHPVDLTFRVNYTGPLSGLLDDVASQIGVDWEYRAGRVKFLGEQTRTYTFWALPSTSESSSSVGGGGDNIFGSATPATTSRNISSDYWANIEQTLDTIVPEFGARYALNRDAGTVTVTGYQNVHERISDFVTQENARLSRQVAIRVDILAFTARDADRRSGGLGVALENAAAGLSLDVTSPSRPITGGTGLSATILDNDETLLENLVGSTAVINALAEQGEVALLNTVSMVAGNNVPTPISVLDERAYISGTTTEVDDEGGESTELETAVLADGVNMVVTPRVMNSGDILMDYTLNISEVLDLENFEVENATVQLPQTSTRNFMQSVNIDSGDTMVIASFDSARTDRRMAGPFDVRAWGLGGEDAYSNEETQIVIMMTPVIVENSNAPRASR